MALKDLTGQRFGKLTVIKNSGKRTNSGIIIWLCKCDCGNFKEASGRHLKTGDAKTCGCEPKYKGYKDRTLAAFNEIFGTYINNSKRRNIEFNLTKEEFRELTQKNCFYCNKIPSNVRSPHTSTYIYNGIDRVDNTKGYTIDNCVACCKMCNQSKLAYTQLEFYTWVKNLSDNLKNKGII